MGSEMAEAFRVDPQKLGDAVQRMADFGRYAEGVFSEIDRLVANLHATWTGEGAAAHAEAHRHWARGEAMMREALAQLQAAGVTAQHNYTGAMSTNVAMWS
jgi:WXG100 family type VII secretion target